MQLEKKIYFISKNKISEIDDKERCDLKNLSEIENLISFSKNKENLIIPFYNGKNLASKYDIKKEAISIISSLYDKSKDNNSNTAILISCANPEIFIQNNKLNIVCFELSAKLSEYYKDYLKSKNNNFEQIYFEEIEKSKEFLEQILTDDSSNFSLIFEGFSEKDLIKLVQYIPEREIEIYINPILKNLEFYKIMEQACYQALRRKVININTAKRFSSQWTKNFLNNSLEYITNKGIEPLLNLLDGKYPVVIVGAGSSLDDNIENIKKLSKIALIIAVDTALIPLLKFNIVPDIVVSSDSQSINSLYILKSKLLEKEIFCDGCKEKQEEKDRNKDKEDDYENPILVAMPTVHPRLIKEYKGKISFSSIPFDLAKEIDSITNPKIEVGAGGTVSALAFEIANLLNPSKIIFVGLDFCYSNGKLHCNNALFDSILYSKISYLYDYQTFITKSMLKANCFIVINEYGIKTRTDPKFLMFLDWFKAQISQNSKKNNIYFLSKKTYGLSFLKILNENDLIEIISENKDKNNLIEKIKNLDFKFDEKDEIKKGFLTYIQKINIEGISAKAMIESVLKRIEIQKDINQESILKYLQMLESNLLNFKSLKTLINMSFQEYLLSVQYEKKKIDTLSFYRNFLKQLIQVIDLTSKIIDMMKL